jgi:hypothetical protein
MVVLLKIYSLTSSVDVEDNADYLRSGNIKFDDQVLRLPYQELRVTYSGFSIYISVLSGYILVFVFP